LEPGLHPRPLDDTLHPGLGVWEGVEGVYPGILVDTDPGHHTEVCNAQLALSRASEVFATLETDVEYVVQTGGLVGIAWERVSKDSTETISPRTLLAIRDILWGVVSKVVCLPLHGTNSAVAKEDPLEHDALVVAPGREEEEAFGVVLANEVEKDSGGFKDAERLWLVFAVDENRDATVGIESDEPRLLLTVGGEIDPLDVVVYDVAIGGLELFEQNGHLVSVGSGCGVEQQGL